MAVKTFGSERLVSTDINTYLANSGLVYVTGASFTGASAASPASAIGCFTSTATNYRILIYVSSVSTDAIRTINLRWRTSTGDDNTAIYNYASQMLSAGSGTFDVNNSAYGATEVKLHSVYYTTQTGSASLDVFNPFISTAVTSATGLVRGGTAAADISGFFGTQATTAKSHTGFSIYPSAGTMTGSYAVYAYRNA